MILCVCVTSDTVCVSVCVYRTPDHDAPETPECVQRSLPPLPPLPSEQDENPYYSAVPVEPTGRDDADYSYCALDEGEYSQPCLPADMQQYETAVDSLAELQLQTKQLPVATKQLPAVPVKDPMLLTVSITVSILLASTH